MSSPFQIFIKFDMNGKSTVTISDLLPTTTIASLKQKVADKEGSNMVDGVRLIYGGKQLSKDDLTLADYNIQKEATLFAVLRLLGGAQAKAGKVHQFDQKKVEKLKLIKIGNQVTDITVSTAKCGICFDEKPVARLHDGHHICADCMTGQCRARVFNGHASIKCPVSCAKEIPSNVAFTVAGLDDDEYKEFELQLNKNTMCFKSCPNKKCGQFIIKEVQGMRVKCPKCKAYEFCWACLGRWKSQDNADCGNPTCSIVASALNALEESWRERVEHGKTISKMEQVPLIRCCPNPACLRLNEYSDKCKHMTCDGKTGCQHQYCQACLKKWTGCKCAFCEYQSDKAPTCGQDGSYTKCQITGLQKFF
eukprot:272068_1